MSKLTLNEVRGLGETTYKNLPRGLASAWANLNGTGTIALRDSQNVSSVADNGTGIYTFNWSNDFSNANYTMSGAGKGLAATAAGNVSEGISTARTASSLPVITTRTDTGAAFDDSQVNISIHGDLA